MVRVAVTGAGVVSPIGVGKDAFWASLSAGASGIAEISHFDASSFEARLAGEVKEPLELPGPVAEAALFDSKIGFAYAACDEALSQAGIDELGANSLLHMGTSLEIFDLGKVVHDGKPDFARVVRDSLVAGSTPLQFPLDTATRLVEQMFGRPGQSLTNCSACAAGAQSIGHAFRAVRSGRVKTAVCGGFDSMINPLGVGGFQLLGALTTSNERGAAACRPFDATRDGTVLGEGAAALVLEPMESAVEEGKLILAEVCGYGSTMDAYSLSAPEPDGDGAIRSMQAALEDARIAACDIHHINVHGTGTQLNDETEAKAIRRVFSETWEDIPVGATKSMTGHLIGAAGAVEAVASLMPLARGIVPSNPSLQRVAGGCELKHVTDTGSHFDGEYVLSNSFGFGGQNATLIFRRQPGKC